MMYYDLVLGLIPLGVATIAAIVFLSGFELTLAVIAGGLFAVALIGHAMFVRAPVDAPAEPAGGESPVHVAD